MTEQPPSAASLWTDLLEKDDRTSPEEYPDMALITFDEFEYLLDHYAAQRVSAEAERWQKRDRQRLEQISTLQETVQSFQSARDERPAPPAVGGYTSVTAGGIVGCWEDKWEIDAGNVPEGALDDLELEVRRALSAVAADRNAALHAAAIRAFGRRVWSDTEEVAYRPGATDERAALLARLQEPNVREAAARAMCKRRNTKQCAAICLSHSSLVPFGECAEAQIVWGEDAGAALARIVETLK